MSQFSGTVGGGGGGGGGVTSITADGGLTGGTITSTGTISLAGPNFQRITAQTTAIGIPDGRDLHVYLDYIPTVASANTLGNGQLSGQMAYIACNPGVGGGIAPWTIPVTNADSFSLVTLDKNGGAPPIGVILMWDSNEGVWTVISATVGVSFT